jgi:phosphoglycolate phosphatase-like HAD superfamily hydrolase
MAPALVLFDIDGTLIRRAGPHHREALVEAVRRVTGLESTTEGIPVQGMLDGDILAEMMRRSGARPAQIQRAMPRVFREAQCVYESTCPALVRKRCPGAGAALRRWEKAGVVIGLVTGNLSRIAWKKMQQAGIAEYFRFGAFAEMGRSRAELVRKAARQARSEGWIARGAPVSLVGDHPNDILAAKANRVRSIAVATGVVPAAELAVHEPDLLLEDLHDLKPEMVLE